jgi:ATP-dependent DNA ligase
MMSDSVFSILDQLSSTSSRKEKENILIKNKDNIVLTSVLEYALNPFKNYYIRKIPDYTPTRTISLGYALSCLDKISNREITGHAAIDYLRNELLSRLDEKDALVLERVILKDLRCGVSESTVNKIHSKLIPTYPCMLASAYDEKLVKRINFPALVQIKSDGMRFNALVNANTQTVEFRSRNGKLINIKSDLLSPVFLEMAKNIGMARVVFDGELLVVDEMGKILNRQEGNGILNKAVKGTISEKESANIRAVLWDVIPFKYFSNEECNVEYQDRLVTLVTAIDHLGENNKHWVSIVQTDIVNNEFEAKSAFEKYYSQGQEGIILKDPKGIWENKRAKHQIKYKGEKEADLLCVDYIPGTGKYKGMLGSLVLISSDSKINVSVGTGFTDSDRTKIKKKDVVEKIITVKYNDLIQDTNGNYSLFLPVFLEVREDKTKANSLKDLKN